MMQHEFEKLAGYEVSHDDYHKIIEPMYMATDLSKHEFVKCLDKKRFALKSKKQLLNEAKKLSESLKETCEHYTDTENENRFEAILKELQERFGGYWRANRKNCYVRDRGCSFPAEIVHYDSEWNVVERFELAKAYWEN